MGVPPSGSGHSPKGGAAKASPAKPSVPNAEERVMIAALRAGKTSLQAFREYCWAKSVVPIQWPTWSRDPRDPNLLDTPFDCPPVFNNTMAEAMASDAFDQGATDKKIAAAFRKGQRIDHVRGTVYRPMRPGERPTPADLIRAMDMDSKMWLVERVGILPVAHAIRGGEVSFRVSDTRPKDGDVKQAPLASSAGRKATPK